MGERFFLDGPPHGTAATLVGDEARHLARVLRARPGDEVVVFAGTGCEWPARVVGITRDTVDLELGPARVDPPAAAPLTLAVALPKGERQKWLVEKLTELGVARLVPLLTQRGVAEATAAARDRLMRTVVEACKQCGRNTLLDIAAPVTSRQLVAGLAPPTRLILAAPAGPPLSPPVATADPVVGCVGPEGGFTAEETAILIEAGAVPARLAPHVLRVETAAVALAAALGAAR
jgi:16S rRNA (uracil1498-N3)-methyltransferase